MSKRLPKTIQTLLDRLEPQMRLAFLEAISGIKNAIQLQIIVSHLEAGRYDQALAALRLDEAFFDPIVRIMSEAYFLGGRDALSRLPPIPDPFRVGDLLLYLTADRPEPSSG